MTKEELIQRLRELQVCLDTEVAHGRADDALIAFINDKEIEEAFDAVPKWYA